MSRLLLDRGLIEELLDHLMAPEQRDLRMEVVCSLPPFHIVKDYREYFVNKRLRISLDLLRKGPRDVKSQDIIEALNRIADREPAFVRQLLHLWLLIYANAIKALKSGTALPADIPAEALQLVARVVQAGDALAPALLATVTAAEQRGKEAETKLAAVQTELEQLQDAYKQEQRDWNAEREALLSARTHDTHVHQDELQDMNEAWRAQLAQQDEKFQLALQSREQALSDALATHEQVLSELKAAHDDVVAGLQRRISEVRHEERDRHHEDRQRTEQLERELQQAQERRPEVPSSVPAALAGSVVINYFALGDTPIERVTDLLGLYRALLDRDLNDERLRRASNATADTLSAPHGVIVVGMEQLLADAANLGLDRLLTLASVRRDALLHHLVRSVDSPRLDGLV